MRNKYRLILVVILVVVIGLLFLGKPPFKNIGKNTQTQNTTTNKNQNTQNNSQQNNDNKSTGIKIQKDPISGVTFHFDEIEESKYLKLTAWPPFVNATNKPFMCKQVGESNTNASIKNLETINNQMYCVSILSQSSNGTTYLKYTYETVLYGKTVAASFSVGLPLCINFAANEKNDCNKKQHEFYSNLNKTIDAIVKSSEF